ncbi:MAG: hypothetical protein KAY32_18385, partial [Candidatus Eisenbacteria sp.]|nr:hypothetical protein [Candidatus Eisenbacteria bacterium]
PPHDDPLPKEASAADRKRASARRRRMNKKHADLVVGAYMLTPDGPDPAVRAAWDEACRQRPRKTDDIADALLLGVGAAIQQRAATRTKRTITATTRTKRTATAARSAAPPAKRRHWEPAKGKEKE